MKLQLASGNEFEEIRAFYWDVIDLMADRNDTVGWKKGIYPSDEFLKFSIKNRELYLLQKEEHIIAAVILNSQWNEGYEGLPWSMECTADEILVPHALAVHPALQGQGIGKQVVRELIRIAADRDMKTVRLDILGGNRAAEKLYTSMGFRFVQAKEMYYPDTGWTEYRMFERLL